VTGPTNETVDDSVLAPLFQHVERLHTEDLWKGKKSEDGRMKDVSEWEVLNV
jgi:hypothetical protein